MSGERPPGERGDDMVNIGDRVKVKHEKRLARAEVIGLNRSGSVVVRFLPGSPHEGREIAVSLGMIRR